MKESWEEDIALPHEKLHIRRKNDGCHDLICNYKDNCDRLYDEAILQIQLWELFLQLNLLMDLILHCLLVNQTEQTLIPVLLFLSEMNTHKEGL